MVIPFKLPLRSNTFMTMSFLLAGAISLFGCWVTSIRLTNVGTAWLVVCVVLAAYSPIPAYWHQKRRIDRRDAAMAIPWCLLTWFFGAVPALVAARMNLPLRDDWFVAVDRGLGFNGASVVDWARCHPLGALLNATYGHLYSYLEAAIVIPALLGRRESVRFFLANTIALMIGITLFALFPAIGPWGSEHFQPNTIQLAAQNQMLTLRHDKAYVFALIHDGAGIIAFPSFHVIWAILAASALWGFRYLRIPLAIFSTLIIFSTLTTGWHYLTDVLGGLLIAVLALWIANAMLTSTDTSASQERRQFEVLEVAPPVK